MALQTDQLDPNAASYADLNDLDPTAALKLAGIAEGAEVNPASTDDLAEGTTNKYDTGAPPTDDEVVTAINNASTAITREAALSQDDLKIVKTAPQAGEFHLRNIQRRADGKYDMQYDDTAV